MAFKIAELFADLTLKDAKFKAGVSNAKSSLAGLGTSVMGGVRTLAYFATGAAAAGGALAYLASEQERADKRLATALGLKELPKLYADAASEIQNTTGIADDAAEEMMTLALNMGANKDNVIQLTKAAIALNKAYGIDAQTAIRGMMLAQNGEWMLLNRAIPQLRSLNTEKKKQRMLDSLVANGMRIATEEMTTNSGKVIKLKNDLGDLGEKLGGPVLTFMGAFSEQLGKELLPLLNQSADGINGVAGSMNTIAEWGRGAADVIAELTAQVQYLIDKSNEMRGSWIGDAASFLWNKNPIVQAGIMIGTGAEWLAESRENESFAKSNPAAAALNNRPAAFGQKWNRGDESQLDPSQKLTSVLDRVDSRLQQGVVNVRRSGGM